MSTFPRLRREKEKSKVFTASINVQNIESLPRCDLYFSDPDAKAKEARMSYAISGGEIKPSFSQQYSASYQDCISADKRSIRSQLLFLDDKDDAFRTNDDNEGHVEEKTHIVASKKSSENSQSHSAGNTHCHIHHETANEQASTNGETMEYSKYDENVKTTSGRGDTRKTPPPLRTLELSEAECTVESLPRTPFISEENDDSLSLEVPSKSQLHTDIYEEMHEEQGDSVTQITNRPKIRLLPNGRLVGLAPALSGKSQNTFDHSPSRRTQIEPLGPIRRLRRSLSRSRRKTESLTSDDAQSASSNKAIGSRIRSTRRKVTKKPKTDDTIASKSRFFRFASNRRALKSRRTTVPRNGAPNSSFSRDSVAFESENEGEYDDFWEVEEDLTFKELVLSTCLETSFFFHALGAWIAEETMFALGLKEQENIPERVSPDDTQRL